MPVEKGKPAKSLTDGQLREIEKRYEAIFHAEPRLKHFDVEVRITRKGERSAFPDKEEMLIGWDEIGDFLKLSEIGVQSMFGKRFREEGVVFYKKVHKPKNNQRRQYACSFPSIILAWCIRESLRRNRQKRDQLVRILEGLGHGKGHKPCNPQGV